VAFVAKDAERTSMNIVFAVTTDAFFWRIPLFFHWLAMACNALNVFMFIL